MMADFSWKKIEEVQKGESVLNMDLSPVKVVASHYNPLGSRKLYSFGSAGGPIFTAEHQFLSESSIPVVVSLEDLFDENPLMLQEKVQQITETTKIMKLENGDVRPASINLTELPTNFPPDTKVYFIWVEGGSYIVDNFVAREELPDFTKWPLAFLTIGLTSKLVEIPEDVSYDEITSLVCFNTRLDLQKSIDYYMYLGHVDFL